MNTELSNAKSMGAAELPSINADYIETLNRIHRLPCIGVQSNTRHCLWRWQYPFSRSSKVDVTLKGENLDYELKLTSSAWLTDSSQLLNWNDYKTDVACIIFCAGHDELISILEQILDDQLVVTAVMSSRPDSGLVADQNSHINSVILGFSIFDDQNLCLAQGTVSIDINKMKKLDGCHPSSMGCFNQTAENVVAKVPLLIDALSLSYSELKSLSINSVIRLQNASVLADKTQVVLELGTQFISAQIDSARGTTSNKSNSVNNTPDIKT